MRRPALVGAALLVMLPLFAGCSVNTQPHESTSESQQSEAERTAVVTLEHGWAKAAPGMTSVFGTLVNHGDLDLQITGVTTEAADSVELHEVTHDGVMQQITEPLTIPAAGSLVLEPGALHVMLMGLTAELQPGAEIALTLTLSDGTAVPITALVKSYSGANEEYGGSGSEHGEDAEGAEHGSHTGSDTESNSHAEH